MDYQKKTPDNVLKILSDKSISFFGIDYFAWPQSFNSTAGPSGGIGGCSVSKFTIEAYVVNDYGPTVYVCGNMYSFDDEKFAGFSKKQIKNWVKF